ncbi:MAG: 50S ribosomal protein L21 [Desulfovibrionales bacterium]
MFAIVETGGKQYRVEEGQELKVEKLMADPGAELALEKVLLTGEGDDIQVGSPYLENAKVTCDVMEHGRGKKIIIFKHKRRKDYRRKQGHRQDFTKIRVKSIQA